MALPVMYKRIVSICTCIFIFVVYMYGSSFKIQSIKFELNASNSEGKSGMKYVLDVNFDGLKGKEVRVCAELLQLNDGKWENVPFSNRGSATYSSGQGVWAQGASKYLPYDGTLIERYVIFFPYDVIVHPQGEVQYQVRFLALEEGELGSDYIPNASGGYYDYEYRTITWNNANSRSNTFEPSRGANDRTNNSSNNYNNQHNRYQPQEHKIQNIKAVYGANGVWHYEFTNYGTFRQHDATYDAYGRVIRELGSLNGTYYLTQDENGVIRVYLRYENGKQKQGIIRYRSQYSEFSIDGRTKKEIVQ